MKKKRSFWQIRSLCRDPFIAPALPILWELWITRTLKHVYLILKAIELSGFNHHFMNCFYVFKPSTNLCLKKNLILDQSQAKLSRLKKFQIKQTMNYCYQMFISVWKYVWTASQWEKEKVLTWINPSQYDVRITSVYGYDVINAPGNGKWFEDTKNRSRDN